MLIVAPGDSDGNFCPNRSATFAICSPLSSGEHLNTQGGNDLCIYLLRYADVLLIYAEGKLGANASTTDAPALAAVDQFENLATGLSSKIWQKLMILDRMRATCDPAGGAGAA